MTYEKWLHATVHTLKEAGVESARLDALILLEDATYKDRAHVLAYPEFELSSEQLIDLGACVKRRERHEPLAYIRGKSEFYGNIFIVDKNVLVPRPESETIIQLLKNLDLPPLVSIIDVGTGSGALAITAKLQIPSATIYGTDVDPNCLRLARNNANVLQADVTFVQGDLIEPVFDMLSLDSILLCNLPYVPRKHTINKAAKHEPSLALFGGTDGLDLYRKLFGQITCYGVRPRYVITESLTFQHEDLVKLAEKYDYTTIAAQNLIQVFKRSNIQQ